MSAPMKYAERTALGSSLIAEDHDLLVDMYRGFTPSGVFTNPYSYLIAKNTDGGIDYYSAIANAQIIYGGATTANHHIGGIDGAIPEAVINAAIADASTDDLGLICLKAATYKLYQTYPDNILMQDNVQLIGEGYNTLLEGFTYGSSELIRCDGISNFAIKNMRFTEDAGAKPPGQASYDNAIGIVDCNYFSCEDLWSSGMGGALLTIQNVGAGSWNALMRNLHSSYDGVDGDVKYPGIFFSDVSISNVVLRDIYIDHAGLAGIDLANSSRCTIDGFFIESCAGSGIILRSSGNKVCNGISRLNTEHGIELISANSNTIKNVDCLNNVINGIQLYRSSYNKILGSRAYDNIIGLKLYDNAGAGCTNNLVSGLTATDTGSATQTTGISELESGDYNIFCDCDLSGNTVTGISTVGDHSHITNTWNLAVHIKDNWILRGFTHIDGGVGHIDITHGLPSTPTEVYVTPWGNAYVTASASDVGAVTFRVNLWDTETQAAPAGDIYFSYTAVYEPT